MKTNNINNFNNASIQTQNNKYTSSYNKINFYGKNIELPGSLKNDNNNGLKKFLKSIGAILIAIQSLVKKEEQHNELQSACFNGDYEAVEKILNLRNIENIDINEADASGKRPLTIACKNGYTKIAELLINQSDIDVNMKNNDGQTLLQYIAENYGDYDEDETYEIIELIVNNPKFNPNVVDTDGDPTIIAMYRYASYDVVKELLNRDDIDVNMKNNDGQTLLQYIAENYDDYDEDETYEIIELIVNNPKFNPNVTDKYGQTVLQYIETNSDIIDENIVYEIMQLIETKK